MHALIVVREFGVLIDRLDLPQGMAEHALEVIHVGVSIPELLLEGNPGDEGGVFRVNAVETLGEPGVDVECHGAMGYARDGGLVERAANQLSVAPHWQDVAGTRK